MGQWFGSAAPKDHHVLYVERGTTVIPLRWPATYASLRYLIEDLFNVNDVVGVYVQDAVYPENRKLWVECEESFQAIVPRRNEKLQLYYAMLTLP